MGITEENQSFFADYIGPRKVYIVSLIISGTGLVLSSQSRNVSEFALFWLVGSVGEGSLYGISEKETAGKRKTAGVVILQRNRTKRSATSGPLL